MKILIVVNYLEGGGIERVLIDVLKSIKEYSKVEVLCINDYGISWEKEVEVYAPVKFLDNNRKKFNFPILKSLYSRLYDNITFQSKLLQRFVKKGSFDKVIAFSDGRAVEIVSRINIEGVKKIAWVHTDFLSIEKTRRSITSLSATYNRFDSVIFVSEQLKRCYTHFLNLKTATSVVSNSIDTTRIQQFVKGVTDIKLPVPSDKYVNLMLLGRFSKEKGFDRVIESLGRMDATLRSRIHLYIVGRGVERINYESRISALNLNDCVTIVGFTMNPYPLLSKMDALLMPSRFEGFGLVSLEAMALGVPVIASDTTGVREILDGGKYGLIVENSDSAFDQPLTLMSKSELELNVYKPRMKEACNRYSIKKFNSALRKII